MTFVNACKDYNHASISPKSRMDISKFPTVTSKANKMSVFARGLIDSFDSHGKTSHFIL